VQIRRSNRKHGPLRSMPKDDDASDGGERTIHPYQWERLTKQDCLRVVSRSPHGPETRCAEQRLTTQSVREERVCWN